MLFVLNSSKAKFSFISELAIAEEYQKALK